MKVLALTKQQVEAAAAGAPLERTGVFTSGLIAVNEQHPIALFFTGRQHAGENLADVLRRRAAELSAPIQMSDAQAANRPGEFATLLASWPAAWRMRGGASSTWPPASRPNARTCWRP